MLYDNAANLSKSSSQLLLLLLTDFYGYFSYFFFSLTTTITIVYLSFQQFWQLYGNNSQQSKHCQTKKVTRRLTPPQCAHAQRAYNSWRVALQRGPMSSRLIVLVCHMCVILWQHSIWTGVNVSYILFYACARCLFVCCVKMQKLLSSMIKGLFSLLSLFFRTVLPLLQFLLSIFFLRFLRRECTTLYDLLTL